MKILSAEKADNVGATRCLALTLAAKNGIPGVVGKESGAAVSIAGAVAICPLTDLTYDFKRTKYNSYVTRIWDASSRTGDAIFTDSHGNLLSDQLDRQERIRAYAGDGDLKQELLSPLWASSFCGLPPILLLAADEDLSVDDSVDVAVKAKADGVEVDLVVWPRMWHDWVMCTEGRDMYGNKPGSAGFKGEHGVFKEATVALELVGTYLKRLAERP